jgi:hypothetical protein
VSQCCLAVLPLPSADGTFSSLGPEPEEVRFASMRCLRSLFRRRKSSTNDLSQFQRAEFYAQIAPPDDSLPSEVPLFVVSDHFKLHFAHCMSVLLGVLKLERNRDVRIAAMLTLESLIDLVRDPDVLGFVLPGASSTLCRIVVGDYKQGSKVVNAALVLWTHLLMMVMADAQNEPALRAAEPSPKAEHPAHASDIMAQLRFAAGSSQSGYADRSRDTNLGQSASSSHGGTNAPAMRSDADGGQSDVRRLTIARSAQWLHGTAANLSPLLSKMASVLQGHPHWSVRQTLVQVSTVSIGIYCHHSHELQLRVLKCF